MKLVVLLILLLASYSQLSAQKHFDRLHGTSRQNPKDSLKEAREEQKYEQARQRMIK
ncbi:MAG: hypothetical protein ACNS62_13695 [Candidatus Cyclobacteriaceae bacterium M3_2C_046]